MTGALLIAALGSLDIPPARPMALRNSCLSPASLIVLWRLWSRDSGSEGASGGKLRGKKGMSAAVAVEVGMLLMIIGKKQPFGYVSLGEGVGLGF